MSAGEFVELPAGVERFIKVNRSALQGLGDAAFNRSVILEVYEDLRKAPDHFRDVVVDGPSEFMVSEGEVSWGCGEPVCGVSGVCLRTTARLLVRR